MGSYHQGGTFVSMLSLTCDGVKGSRLPGWSENSIAIREFEGKIFISFHSRFLVIKNLGIVSMIFPGSIILLRILAVDLSGKIPNE